MADIKYEPHAQHIREEIAGMDHNLEQSDQSETDLIELMFFAYRDFISDPDAILEAYGFGRAHHRVIHFVNQNPGLTVADLLTILRITKQSLARVLKQLVKTGFIEQKPGPEDRRQRLLYATPAGRTLAIQLSAPQSARFQSALDSLSHAIESETGTKLDSRAVAARFLFSLINKESRPKAARLSRREDLL